MVRFHGAGGVLESDFGIVMCAFRWSGIHWYLTAAVVVLTAWGACDRASGVQKTAVW